MILFTVAPGPVTFHKDYKQKNTEFYSTFSCIRVFFKNTYLFTSSSVLYVMDLDQSQQSACKVKVSRDLRDVTFSMPGTLHTHAWKEAHVFMRFGLAPNDLLSL